MKAKITKAVISDFLIVVLFLAGGFSLYKFLTMAFEVFAHCY